MLVSRLDIFPACTVLICRLGYAALFGMRKDLNLVGTNYSTLGSIFYVGWLVWQLPGNLLVSPLLLFIPGHCVSVARKD